MAIAKYRKKPVVIEAFLWEGGTSLPQDFKDWFGKELPLVTQNKLVIRTLEGNMTAEKGDFIIKGVKGEFYPCKPDIFEQTYEEVE